VVGGSLGGKTKKTINIENEKAYKAVIETPKNSKNIYRYIIQNDELFLDRVLLAPLMVPFNIALITGTKWHTDENLKTIILHDDIIPPRTIVHVVPIALIRLREHGIDSSIVISKLKGDENLKEVKDAKDISKIHQKEIKMFFSNLDEFTIGDIVSKEYALNAIEYSINNKKLV